MRQHWAEPLHFTLVFAASKMVFHVKLFVLGVLLVVLAQIYMNSACLITNCPRGGKRSGKIIRETPKPCISCGPGNSGQCFGPEICCGPFGCLLGTRETARCLKEGNFHENEPCVAGSMPCRKNTGRCASEGICCSQDACYEDKTCFLTDYIGEKNRLNVDLYNLLGELSSE